MRCCLLVFCVVLMAAALSAQARNDSQFAMVINDADGVAPNNVAIAASSSFDFHFAGTPNAPFVVGFSSGLSVGAISVGGIQVDIGPTISIFLDGVAPTTFFDLFAQLPLEGMTTLSFNVPANASAGVFGAFQALSIDVTAPTGLRDSAAALVAIETVFDYGSLSYLRNGDLHSAEIATGTRLLGPLTNGVEVSQLILNQHTDFYGPEFESIYRNDDPAHRGAFTLVRSNGGPTGFPLFGGYSRIVRTIHGDVLQISDVTGTSGASSLFILKPGMSVPSYIEGSYQPKLGAETGWKKYIAISQDQSLMVAVTRFNRVILFRLDGSNFPTTGRPFADVTPSTPLVIEDHSTRVTAHRVYFSGGNKIYSVPRDATAPTQELLLPQGVFDHGFFHHTASDAVFVNAGIDILKITDSPTTTTVVNITNLALPPSTHIEPFGTSHTGRDGRFDVSPDGQRCAFCLRTNLVLTLFDLEMYAVTTDGLGTPCHLTGDDLFEPAVGFTLDIDHVVFDINFYANEKVMAFIGDGCFNNNGDAMTDLYSFDLSMPGAPVLYNITQTNGQSGASLPILAATGSRITPAGIIRLRDRVLFQRLGLIGTGPSDRADLVGVDYATLTPYDISGTEFTLGVSPLSTVGPCGSSYNTTDAIRDLQFVAGSNDIWFRRSLSGQFDNLFSFDASIAGLAIPATNFLGPGPFIDELVLDPDGGKAYFSMTVGSSDTEIHVVDAALGIPMQLTDDGELNTTIKADSLRVVRSGSQSSGLLYVSTFLPALPDAEHVLGLNLASGLLNFVDNQSGSFEIITGSGF